MPEQTISILIADDHPVVRDGLRRILETEPDFKVVAEAGNGLEATRLAQKFNPDVMLLDIFMPEASGFDVLRQLQGSKTRFLILTAGGNRNELLQAVQLQAHGVLTKDAPVELLLKAIRKIAAGEYWIDRELLAKAVRPAEPTPNFGLTDRELEIISEICAGASNKDIAAKLGISDLTVKRHLTNVFDKTGVSSRLELALFAIAHKLQGET